MRVLNAGSGFLRVVEEHGFEALIFFLVRTLGG